MGFARSVREAASSRAGDQRARSAGGDRDDRLAVKLFRAKTRRREEEGRTVRPPYSGKRSASRGGLTGKAASRQTRHLRVFARNNQHPPVGHVLHLAAKPTCAARPSPAENGRAWCREEVCQYV